MRSLILVLHICAGTLGMLSGFVAMAFRKGSRSHGLAGDVFFVSMLILSASGICLAAMKSEPTNILGGALTFYLVATGWIAGRRMAGRGMAGRRTAGQRNDAGTGMIDWLALLVVSFITAVEFTYGTEAALSATGMKYEYPPWPYFFLGSVALLAALGDVRLLVREGAVAKQRMVRHLWRMCFAWFIASGSIFLARQERFPEIFRKTGILVLLSFLPLLLMIFWFIRVRFTKWMATADRGKREQPSSIANVAGRAGLSSQNPFQSDVGTAGLELRIAK
jgi:hypothetical protein